MQLQKNFSLTELNTLGLLSTAATLIALTNLTQLHEIAQYLAETKSKFLVLGGGSNVILPEYYNGVVIHNQLSGIEQVDRDSKSVLIKVMAGVEWDYFVEYALEHKWYGLENLSLIPGTVGASPIQNIGAYGIEVGQFIEHVEIYDTIEQRFKYIMHKDCEFSYRNSIFKKKPHYIVVAVAFRLLIEPELNTSYKDVAKKLAQIENPTPNNLRNIVIKIRTEKLPDPKVIGNAGSFFHNPIVKTSLLESLLKTYPDLPNYQFGQNGLVKVSAGWLIDNMGLKGYKLGHVGVYKKQALVLVNHGKATQTEILNFAQIIQNKVKQQYNIELTVEPMVVS